MTYIASHSKVIFKIMEAQQIVGLLLFKPLVYQIKWYDTLKRQHKTKRKSARVN